MQKLTHFVLITALALLAAISPVDVQADADSAALTGLLSVEETAASCTTCWPREAWTCTNGVRKDDDACDVETPTCVPEGTE